ncbi:MAG: tRNA uridine-5-carboxymethylaminomethyl(34) synthesis GTPase MnmE [Ramlibacter sp.]|jgi:tRNA modification GTPase|uniref:tRNA uridine-5-carboxymethylaminomethyl(34) synthesis GTPase MnmE n=1 Tax=Ramlibacter sp. TaxID=1917967 RepID=UPI00261E65F7|nr:tRNA uridine-5-carboxymethylaminomethyl(34) synthesis GTPase MnmE [Ramlibacter sp.]MDH4375080.1 tRNA uridine-5-carboxymethylaminomethyl(34) synthesis GTPase MnmE [Ramlibacter sp.]
MLADRNAPIAAIATAPGRGAVGIVRVSGRGLGALVRALCGRELQARQARYGPFVASDGRAIDHGLALFFPAPHSFTGEDVLELQAHGGPVVLQLLLARCLEAAAEIDAASGESRLPGLRVADPGEFTQRAFLNDKIDLAQAEAIADLIDASTEAAARSASRSLAGEFSREVHALRDALIHLRMLVEATLDFPEEEIDFLRQSDAQGQLDRLQARLAQVLARTRQGALLREGITVVIAGQPNAGKSSLLNALAGAELAIVTPIAGTTRDVVSQSIQIEGVPLNVVDTAGLRESEDPVEKIGIERAWERITGADAVLFLHDLSRLGEVPYQADDARIRATLAERLPAQVPVIEVFNKQDLAPAALPDVGLALSARTGEGLAALRARLLEVAGWQSAPEGVWLARERHVQALGRVGGHLQAAHDLLAAQASALDLMAEELRLGQNALGEITGEFTADDLLGVIFSKFCIGK